MKVELRGPEGKLDIDIARDPSHRETSKLRKVKNSRSSGTIRWNCDRRRNLGRENVPPRREWYLIPRIRHDPANEGTSGNCVVGAVSQTECRNSREECRTRTQTAMYVTSGFISAKWHAARSPISSGFGASRPQTQQSLIRGYVASRRDSSPRVRIEAAKTVVREEVFPRFQIPLPILLPHVSQLISKSVPFANAISSDISHPLAVNCHATA